MSQGNSARKKRVLILGGGFAGIEVLKWLRKQFSGNPDVEITLVSRENFLLFTPLLPEVFSGMIGSHQITTPVRMFLKNSNFYEAGVDSIDFRNKKVTISHPLGDPLDPAEVREHVLEYDYVVVALGNEENFHGLQSVERHSFTMTDVTDAMRLRNHVIGALEQASIESQDAATRKKLLTFVIVGGGFNGVETAGELNDFVRGIANKQYPSISPKDIRVIVIHSSERILEQVGKELGQYAFEDLQKRGVEFILNKHVKDATKTSATLDDGTVIPTFTIIWSAGVIPSKMVSGLECAHDDKHRIKVNEYLEIENFEGSAYAVGDCAAVPINGSNDVYPPTAQHAVREAKLLARNLALEIEMRPGYKEKFDYHTKGMMAEIGKRNGVAILYGVKIRGFPAWWIWRTYYLLQLPTVKKKLKVMSDWTISLFYDPDVSAVRRFKPADKEAFNPEKQNRRASAA